MIKQYMRQPRRVRTATGTLGSGREPKEVCLYPRGNSIDVGTVRALYILDDDFLVLHIKCFQLALKLLVSLGMGENLALTMGDELPTVARLELDIIKFSHWSHHWRVYNLNALKAKRRPESASTLTLC